MLSFVGWEAAAPLTTRFADPARQLPRVIGIALAVTSVLYLGLAVATIGVLGTGGAGGAGAATGAPLAALLRDGRGDGGDGGRRRRGRRADPRRGQRLRQRRRRDDPRADQARARAGPAGGPRGRHGPRPGSSRRWRCPASR